MTILERLINRQKTLSILHSPANTEVYTPIELVNEMLDKLPIEEWYKIDNKFCDPAVKSGIFLSEIIIRLMMSLKEIKRNEKKRYIYIIENMIYGYATSELSMKVVEKLLLLDEFDVKHNIKNMNFLEEKNNMKFDVIVGNPPFQDGSRKSKNGKGINTKKLWNRFVKKSIECLHYDGYLSLIHPADWRNVSGQFLDIKNLLLSKQMLYLEIHDEADGMKTFNAMTRYDWYLCRNRDSNKNKTIVKFQNGNIMNYDLSKLEFIPNGNINFIKKLIPKNKDNRIELLHNYQYSTKTDIVQEKKTKHFCHPIIYMINKGDKITFLYSNIKKENHFGTPKFIWSNGYIPSFGCIVDSKGEYGITGYCYAIIDSKKNLKLIKAAFDSKKFRSLMFDCKMGENSVNKKVISLFKKDFWKYFVDDNGNEI